MTDLLFDVDEASSPTTGPVQQEQQGVACAYKSQR